jgi:hypothetical protein
MKKYLSFLLLFSFLSSSHLLIGQESCKVLSPNIANEYNGGCKKGLAHGKGVAMGIDRYEGRFKAGLPSGNGSYTWANGEIYVGNWKNGKRHGEGTFTFTKDGRKLTQKGVWRNDEFLREVKEASYSIGHILNLDRYTIKKTGEGNMVLITHYEQGKINSSPREYNLQVDSGSTILVGQANGYENVIFPVSIKMTYIVFDKVQRSIPVRVRFEVIINEPGVWEIKLYN